MNHVESLSPRTLLDATLVGGILMVTGTAGNDRIFVGGHVNGRISATIRNLDSSSSQTEAFDVASVQGVSINGGDGFDIITMGPHLPAVTICCDGGDDMIVGDSPNEPINGAGRNKLHGNAGNDSITGAALHDRIFGDDGRDTLVVERGRTGSKAAPKRPTCPGQRLGRCRYGFRRHRPRSCGRRRWKTMCSARPKRIPSCNNSLEIKRSVTKRRGVVILDSSSQS